MTLRWWHALLAVIASLSIHSAVAVWSESREVTIREAGVANAQIAILGNSQVDVVINGGEIIPEVAEPVTARRTIPPINAKEATRAEPHIIPDMTAAAIVPRPQSSLPVLVPASPRQLPEDKKPNSLSPVEAPAATSKTQPAQVPASKAVSVAKPQVMATEVKPTERAAPVETLKPSSPVAVEPTGSPVRVPQKIIPNAEQKTAEDVEVAKVIKPIEPTTKTPKPKVVRKKKQATAKQQANRDNKEAKNGRSNKTAKQGRASGDNTSKKKSGGTKAGGKNRGVEGNAAVSNYPGKIRRKLRRHQRYPRNARSGRLRGTVRVSFTIGADGGARNVRIADSSGESILDAAAIALVKRASPFPKIPAGANRNNWPFSIPIRFAPP